MDPPYNSFWPFDELAINYYGGNCGNIHLEGEWTLVNMWPVDLSSAEYEFPTQILQNIQLTFRETQQIFGVQMTISPGLHHSMIHSSVNLRPIQCCESSLVWPSLYQLDEALTKVPQWSQCLRIWMGHWEWGKLHTDSSLGGNQWLTFHRSTLTGQMDAFPTVCYLICDVVTKIFATSLYRFITYIQQPICTINNNKPLNIWEECQQPFLIIQLPILHLTLPTLHINLHKLIPKQHRHLPIC